MQGHRDVEFQVPPSWGHIDGARDDCRQSEGDVEPRLEPIVEEASGEAGGSSKRLNEATAATLRESNCPNEVFPCSRTA
jgi:hypothetical protein